jgi:predicted transcriptional regulator
MSSEEIPGAGTAETAGADEIPEVVTARGGAGERAAGTHYDILDLTDPKMMRALAHPVRMALLELIEVTGTLTATQASEVLGESPANCAFHLRTLGKYGYIAEAGGGKGRERPWKRVDMRLHLSVQHEEPSTNLTARTLQQFWLDRVLARARKALTNPEELPEEWRDAKAALQDLVFLTAGELRELSTQVLELTDRFRDRKADAASRPEGALPVELLLFGYPLTDLAELAADEADDQ